MVACFPERPVGPRSRQGDPEEEKCIGYYEENQPKQEEGMMGGDASLDETGYSPRGLAGSRWLGMVKAFRKVWHSCWTEEEDCKSSSELETR